jgi:hypothetical protein
MRFHLINGKAAVSSVPREINMDQPFDYKRDFILNENNWAERQHEKILESFRQLGRELAEKHDELILAALRGDTCDPTSKPTENE